jgi:hypothetical protein
VKKSKCAFGARSVAYLKHVISAVSVTVVKSRLARGHHELLVCWKGLASSESSWVDLEDFQKAYPSFQLEDKLIVGGGRDVMWGKKYSRRRKQKQGIAQASAGTSAPTGLGKSTISC